MAAVSLPGYPSVAPPAPSGPAKRRRWWLIGIVTAWGLVLTLLAVWSVRHDPPTVADQRDLAAAMTVMDRAAEVLAAAADGPDRVVVLGFPTVDSACRITPLRSGAEAIWDMTVYVQADGARDALEEIAAALPADYRAETAGNETSNRIGLHADAGGFVGVDADAQADAQVLTLTVSTGCRPTGSGEHRERSEENHAPADPQSRDLPAALTAPMRALRLILNRYNVGPPVACPEGGARRMYTTVSDSAPKDLGSSLQGAVGGATVVRADPQLWAYRTGSDSVVVAVANAEVTIKVTTGCR
jgi:hypothetical protein